ESQAASSVFPLRIVLSTHIRRRRRESRTGLDVIAMLVIGQASHCRRAAMVTGIEKGERRGRSPLLTSGIAAGVNPTPPTTKSPPLIPRLRGSNCDDRL